MFEKYLSKKLNVKTFDCCHLASEFLKDNFEIDTSVVDNYPRFYTRETAYDCIIDGFTKNDFVEVSGDCKKGDILITRQGGGCVYICVDDKIALTIAKQTLISDIKRIQNHLRHRSLL